MNTDIKSLIPSMHAELKRMQSRVAELQVSLQQGSSDEKTILEENSGSPVKVCGLGIDLH